MEESTGNMIKLTAFNYAVWKPKMEDLLYIKDLWKPIVMPKEEAVTTASTDAKTSSTSTSTSDVEWTVLNRKCAAQIRQWIDRSIFQNFANEHDAYVLWQKLEKMYARTTAQNKANLMRRLVNLKYKDGNSVSEHMSEFQGIVDQLNSMKMTVDDELQALLMLSSLPKSWDTLVVSVSNSAPDGKLTMDMVKDRMLNEESRRKDEGHTPENEALVTEKQGKQEWRGRSKNPHNQSQQRGRSKSRSRHDKKCHHCGKLGHFIRECRKLKAERTRNQDAQTRTNDTATVTEEVVVVQAEDYINLASQDSTWVVDSGASYHVTSRLEFFSTYTQGDFGRVRMGNDDVSKIIGIGNIHLETNLGCRLVLKDVRHVPDIRLNLISTGILDDDGYSNYFGEGKWKLTKGNLVIAKGKKDTSLYHTEAKLCRGEVNTTRKEVPTELWHKRLGHMSEKGLSILSKKALLPGMKGTSLPTCVDCIMGKQHRVAFRSSPPSRKANILDLIHTDVCSMSCKSLGGATYFVTFIDDHSRKVWTFALKTKDQVQEVFKHFHVKVERETGRRLKCVRADNGGEYRGPFEEYCRSFGIRLEKSVPKTPQHNGVAERMNRTICERVRCMLSNAKLPNSFWGEAMRTAVDLINLSPSVPLNYDVPERVWTGKDVSYKHLKVFGCRAFVHIPKDERSKLDGKAKQCIFVGHAHEEFGYRLWDPVNKRIIRSRDVVFLEDQTIEDFEKPEKPQSDEIPVNLEPVSPPTNSDEGGATPDTDDVHPPARSPEPEQVQPEVQLRRSTRERQPSRKYSPNEYVMLTDGGEPESYDEAITDQHKTEWLKAMQEEMKSLHENHTFDLVKLPQGRKALKNKWVYKIKSEEGNSQPRYKARLVVKGFGQKKGVDFEEIFSPVVKMSSIRVVLGLAASLNLEVEQLDVKTAFLHGDLDEEIYMEQPEGFQVKGKEKSVCRLKKSLYGLKQAPRQWYKKFDSFMEKNEYNRTTADHCVFIKKFSDGDFIILLLYVDDMLIVGQDIGKINKLKKELSKSFAMKDLGPAKQILGMRITRNRQNRRIWLSQERYVEKVLERFNMSKAKSVSSPLASHFKLNASQCPSSKEEKSEMSKVPYASVVGSLMYAMVCTRPDIAHAVGVVSRFLSNPGKEHWTAVKWILRYLRGTSSHCLCFGNCKPVLEGYTDSDMAGDMDTRKSISGYLITFAGGAVSWQSRLQKCIALSTTEAEYIAITEGCKEMLWMEKFLQELDQKQESYVLYCDSQSAIHLSKNQTFHSRSKHIDIRYHWIRDVLENKLLQVEKIHTNDNGADMMTKNLPREKLAICREIAGMEEPCFT
ncbi:hypothetical protein ACOSQ3_000896 [Xanthoceras sorbifolium]